VNDIELKHLWQQQTPGRPGTAASDREIMSAMKGKMNRFGRTIFWRDIREVAASAILVLIFLPKLFLERDLVSKAGALVIVISAIYISLRLVLTQRKGDRPAAGDSVRACLLHEVQKVDRQIHLLRTILWWYLAPLYIGSVMFVWGLGGPSENKVYFALGYAVLCAFIWWMNQYAVKKSLVPLKTELEQTLREIAPPDETALPGQTDDLEEPL
jgi:hypothetical protein